MTTSDATGETRKARDIGELYAMDSYQGMTDEEIEKLIKFKSDLAAMNAETETLRKQNEENRANLSSALATMVENENAVLKAVLESRTEYKSSENGAVELKTFVPVSIGDTE